MVSQALPALAPWLAYDAINQVYCTRCRRVLWDCPSCGDFQCGCKVSWHNKAPKRDRKFLPRQHYDKNKKPIMGEPPVDFSLLVEDEEEDDE